MFERSAPEISVMGSILHNHGANLKVEFQSLMASKIVKVTVPLVNAVFQVTVDTSPAP